MFGGRRSNAARSRPCRSTVFSDVEPELCPPPTSSPVIVGASCLYSIFM